jgi:aminomethyltransferase
LALRRTQLHRYHREHGELVEFAGFEMPLWYRGIREEHMAVREAAGLFDVSHMGRFLIEGEEAPEFLDYVLPRRVAGAEVGRGLYTTLLNKRGGIVDDVIAYRLGGELFLMVVNAGNREKDRAWLERHIAAFRARLIDLSDRMALLSLQGPLAQEILQPLVADDLTGLRRFRIMETRLLDGAALIARTGYTGEDGFEIFVPDSPIDNPARAERVWNQLLEAGGPKGLLPCGLGARDTLRLEAGLCLYGQDIDESTTPLEARLDPFINLDKPGFIGREALLAQAKQGVTRLRVGLRMVDRGIPRRSFKLLKAGQAVGVVTSGTYSPLLRVGIAMGYVPPELAEVGEELEVALRAGRARAVVVKPPFYDTGRYGFRRTKP